MKTDILRRLIRAIAEGATDDLPRLARKVVDAERRSGHVRLADELASILASVPDVKPSLSSAVESSLHELPISKRHRELLVTFLSRETLDHHMVLEPSVEARFQRIEREYAARERLLSYGLRPRKTVLLHGPPGCGKSLGAKRLAWNTGLPVMKVRFDTLLSSYFGESAANLRSVFDAARERPCVLLLDECDFIARSRGTSRDVGEAARIVNTLLQLMEEYDAPGILVATTNVEESLDEALFRRFDEVLFVAPPGHEQIEQILKLTLSAMKLAPGFCWGAIVSDLKGASAAHVVKVAQDAAKMAVLEGKKTVEAGDFRQAITEAKRHGTDTPM